MSAPRTPESVKELLPAPPSAPPQGPSSSSSSSSTRGKSKGRTPTSHGSPSTLVHASGGGSSIPPGSYHPPPPPLANASSPKPPKSNSSSSLLSNATYSSAATSSVSKAKKPIPTFMGPPTVHSPPRPHHRKEDGKKKNRKTTKESLKWASNRPPPDAPLLRYVGPIHPRRTSQSQRTLFDQFIQDAKAHIAHLEAMAERLEATSASPSPSSRAALSTPAPLAQLAQTSNPRPATGIEVAKTPTAKPVNARRKSKGAASARRASLAPNTLPLPEPPSRPRTSSSSSMNSRRRSSIRVVRQLRIEEPMSVTSDTIKTHCRDDPGWWAALDVVIFNRVFLVEGVVPSALTAYLNNVSMLALEAASLRSLPDTLTSGLANFRHNLTSLSLAKNRLTSLGRALSPLTRLVELSLHDNNIRSLDGALPNAPLMTSLNVSFNGITSIPNTFTQLKSLRAANMAKNKIESLPPSFGRLARLSLLDLQGNSLTALPTSFGSLGSLKEAYLSNNRLRHLPHDVGRLTRLETLSIAVNHITSLPSSIGSIVRGLTHISILNTPLSRVSERTVFGYSATTGWDKGQEPSQVASLMDLACNVILAERLPYKLSADLPQDMINYLESAYICHYCGDNFLGPVARAIDPKVSVLFESNVPCDVLLHPHHVSPWLAQVPFTPPVQPRGAPDAITSQTPSLARRRILRVNPPTAGTSSAIDFRFTPSALSGSP